MEGLKSQCSEKSSRAVIKKTGVGGKGPQMRAQYISLVCNNDFILCVRGREVNSRHDLIGHKILLLRAKTERENHR